MLYDRSTLIPLAAAAGLVASCLLWAGASGGSASSGAPGRLVDRTAAPTPALLMDGEQPSQWARLLANPLFALTTGKGAVTVPTVKLTGVEITATRKAALVSINGASAEWLSVGESRDGVTLVTVEAVKITLDTATGFMDVSLWESGAGPAAAASSPSPASSAMGPGSAALKSRG